jgi:hypothetical protein
MSNRLKNIFNRNLFIAVSIAIWVIIMGIIALGSVSGTNDDLNAVSIPSNLQPTTAMVARLSDSEEPEFDTTSNSPISQTQIIPPTLTTAPGNTQEITITMIPWDAQEPYIGIWLSKDELSRLPTSGIAWDNLKMAADQALERPSLGEMNDMVDVYVLAKALVYGRTGVLGYQQEVIAAIREVIGTERGSETLALGRNLVSYIIAADLINLPQADSVLDAEFRNWLRRLQTEQMDDGRSLQDTHETRPNNWGTHAGASRAAIAIYLGDTDELEQTALVFKGWLGDQSAYDGFDYGRRDWQNDPDNPVGINPPGSEKDGHDIGGALPEEMRRGGRFDWPPSKTGYAWEGLQGAVVLAEILSRAGYPVWEWEQQALLRAVEFLYSIDWPAEGDDEWQVWLINHAYDTDFPAVTPTRPGKNMGWTDWTMGN